MQLRWRAHGPERPQSEDVPPVSMRLSGYLLCYDAKLARTVYVCAPGFDGFGESYALDGRKQGWRKLGDKKIRLEGEGIVQGDYDASRGGIVAWKFGYDYERQRSVPRALLIVGGEARELEPTTGDLPHTLEDEDRSGLIAYDAGRLVWVCVCGSGVYELDTDNVWRRVSEDVSALPAQWNDHGFGGLYDAKRRRTLLYCFQQQRGDYRYVLLSWDGAKLEEVTLDGLPQKQLHYGLFRPGCVLCAHPEHGVALFAGYEHGLYALGAKKWQKKASAPDGGPPRMGNAHMVYDERLKALIVGPGFHEGDSGGREQQRLFYMQQRTGWTRMGSVAADSPLEQASYGKVNQACWRGQWYAVATHCLHTFRFDAAQGWVELVDKKRGEKLWGWQMGQLLSTDDALLAIGNKGDVFAFDGDKWRKRCKGSDVYKERDEAMLACEPAGRVLSWGGAVRGRKSNHTFVLEGNAWRQIKAKSPQPKDFETARKKDMTIEFGCVYDTTLGCVVRFGYEEVALLDGDTWIAKTPKGYKRLVGPRHFQHVPAHDAKTGETLVIDLTERRVVRFDLGGCVEVATFDYPAEIAPARQHDTPAYAKLCDTLCFDPDARALCAQVIADKWGCYALDLADAFEAAAKLGPRKLVALSGGGADPDSAQSKAKASKTKASKTKASKAKASKTKASKTKASKTKASKAKRAGGATVPQTVQLYFVDDSSCKHWRCAVHGRTVERRWGAVGKKAATKKEALASAEAAANKAASLAASKRKSGYRDASELTSAQLVKLCCANSRALTVKAVAKRGTSRSRVGGLPNGVSWAKWPKRDEQPLGFLLQLETHDLLKKHAAVAVFCTTDGSATEDQDNNCVLLLRQSALDKQPAEPKAEVPRLKPRPIAVAAPKPEIDESRIAELLEGDAQLVDAVDRLVASGKLQQPQLSDKLGGAPSWVQGALGDEGFVAQLDFDGLSLPEWSDAGLFGCLYIFVDAKETRATAFWQYT